MGSLPGNFLQMRRMDKASELLRTTNQTVLQIAVAVGYESASQFSQIFKAALSASSRAISQANYQRNV